MAGEIKCDSWDASPECYFFEDAIDFIRPPPPVFCDGSFEEQFTCNNDVPFPFRINTDGSKSEPTLVVVLISAAIFSVLLAISGVCLWRNKKHLRKYLTCMMRSPGSTIRKNSPSAASTSDDSDGVVYTDNLDYKKKALLSSVITPPSGVKFSTDNAMRYAPHIHQHQPQTQPHHNLDGHIYEEIANNYPVCMTASAYCHGMPVSIHPHPRYVVFKDGIPLAQQAFIQRQSWLDLLQHPPCQETGFNLYSEGCTKLPACPNCYYPSLPRDSSRIDTASEAGHVTVNPVDMDEMANNRGTRRGFPRMTPYHCSAISPDDISLGAQQMFGSTQYVNRQTALQNNLRGSPRNGSGRTLTLQSSGQRRRAPRKHKCNNKYPHLQISQNSDILTQRNQLHLNFTSEAMQENSGVNHL